MASPQYQPDYESDQTDMASPHPVDYEADQSSDIQVTDGRYKEVSAAYSVPTKLGDGTHSEGDRPGSAGTTGSAQLMIEDDTEATLSRLTVQASTVEDAKDLEVELLPTTSQLLSRAKSPGHGIAPAGFSFGKAEKKPLDLTGTRKPPSSKLGQTSNGEAGYANPSASSIDQSAQDDSIDASFVTPLQQHGSYTKMQSAENAADGSYGAASMPHEADAWVARTADVTQKSHKKGDGSKKKRKRKEQAQAVPVTPPYPPQHTTSYRTATFHPENSNDDRFSTGLPQNDTGIDARTPEDSGSEGMHTSHVQLQDNLQASTALTMGKVDASAMEPLAQAVPEDDIHEDLHAATPPAIDARHSTGAAQISHDATDDSVREDGHSSIDSNHRDLFRIPRDKVSRPSPARSPQTMHVTDSNDCLHNVLERNSPVRATKGTTKSKRRTTASLPGAGRTRLSSVSSDLRDVFLVLGYKIQETEDLMAKQAADERAAFTEEMEEIKAAKQSLQDELDASIIRHESLTAVIEKHKAKVAAYQSKVGKLKTFVDGLGNDFSGLKKEASATRRRSEQLLQEAHEGKADREVLSQQLMTCSEKAAHVKDDMAKTCYEALAKLHDAEQSNAYLQEQLSEKVGLLAEERDRRTSLETQLDRARAADETVSTLLKSSNDAVIDELHEIHATLEEAENSKKLADVMDKCLNAMQALKPHHTATIDDIAVVKSLVETLSEFTASRFESVDRNKKGPEMPTTSFDAQFSNSLKALKEELNRQEELTAENVTHRETIATLQERLKTSETRVCDAKAKVSDHQIREATLRDHNIGLEAKLTTLQTKLSTRESDNTNKQELHEQNRALKTELVRLKAEVAAKVDELRAIAGTNNNLQQEVQELQMKLTASEERVPDFGPEKAAMEKKYQKELERAQQDMSTNAQTMINADKSRFENRLHQISTERDTIKERFEDAQKQLEPCRVELHLLKEQLKAMETQMQRPVSTRGSNRKSEAETTSERTDPIKDKYDRLSKEIKVKDAQLQSANESKVATQKQIEDLEHAVQKAESSEKAARAQLAKDREDAGASLTDARKQLAAAEANVKKAEVGLEDFRKSCDKAIRDEKAKNQNQVEAVQQSLEEAQAELEQRTAEAAKFLRQVELTFEEDDRQSKSALLDADRRASAAETALHEAVTAHDKELKVYEVASKESEDALRAELEEVRQRADSAERRLSQFENGYRKESNAESLPVPPRQLRVLNARQDTTPLNSSNAVEPPKPRKKADRSANAIVDADAVPVPELFRRPSSRHARSRSPEIVEAETLKDLTDPFDDQSQRKSSERPATSLQRNASMFAPLPENDEMLDGHKISSAPLPEVVEETQPCDVVPSFAAFNSSLASSKPPKTYSTSSGLSLPSLGITNNADREDQTSHVSGRSFTPSLRRAPSDARDDRPPSQFSVYDETQDTQGPPPGDIVEAQGHLQDSLTWSQADQSKYTFQKSFAHPNSGSKLVHRDREGSVNGDVRGMYSDRHTPTESIGRTAEAPRVRGEGRNSGSRGMHPGNPTGRIDMHNSSPDFLQVATNTYRKANTYAAPPGAAGPSQRRSSRTNSTATTDPRRAVGTSDNIAGTPSQSTLKRKSSGQITEGYEGERRKRVSQGAASSSGYSASRSLRSQTPSNPVPEFTRMTAGSRNSRQGSVTPQSYIRSSQAAASSRTVRGSRKSTSSVTRDQMDARFNQELNAGR